MARLIDEDELIEHWTLVGEELAQVAGKRGATRLGFALLLKFATRHGRFPRSRGELPDNAIGHVARQPKKLPYVPTAEELRDHYHTVWTARRTGDIVLIKTLLYTGVRVAELTRIRLADVDLDACRIRITQGKGGKDRSVPFPASFKETLALHIAAQHGKGALFLFESSWKKPYSTRGVRAMLARYAAKAGLAHNMPPHRLRHFLFTWLKEQGIDDAHGADHRVVGAQAPTWRSNARARHCCIQPPSGPSWYHRS